MPDNRRKRLSAKGKKLLASVPAAVSVRERKEFAKFARMLKIHIPMAAVVIKLRSAGFSADEIDAFEKNKSCAKKKCSKTSRGLAAGGQGGGLLASIQGFNKSGLKKSPQKCKKAGKGKAKKGKGLSMAEQLKARRAKLKTVTQKQKESKRKVQSVQATSGMSGGDNRMFQAIINARRAALQGSDSDSDSDGGWSDD